MGASGQTVSVTKPLPPDRRALNGEQHGAADSRENVGNQAYLSAQRDSAAKNEPILRGPVSSIDEVELNATIGGVYIPKARVDIAYDILAAYKIHINVRLATVQAFVEEQIALRAEFPVIHLLSNLFNPEIPASNGISALLARGDILLKQAQYRLLVDVLGEAENQVDKLIQSVSGYQERQDLTTQWFINRLQEFKIAGGLAVGVLTAGSGTLAAAAAGATYMASQEASEQAVKLHLGMTREIDWEGILVDAVINIGVGVLTLGLFRFLRGKNVAKGLGDVGLLEFKKIPEQKIRQFAVATLRQLFTKQTFIEMTIARGTAMLQMAIKSGYESARGRTNGESYASTVKKQIQSMFFDESGDIAWQQIFFQSLLDAIGSATNRAAIDGPKASANVRKGEVPPPENVLPELPAGQTKPSASEMIIDVFKNEKTGVYEREGTGGATHGEDKPVPVRKSAAKANRSDPNLPTKGARSSTELSNNPRMRARARETRTRNKPKWDIGKPTPPDAGGQRIKATGTDGILPDAAQPGGRPSAEIINLPKKDTTVASIGGKGGAKGSPPTLPPTREAVPALPGEKGANPDQPLSPLMEEIIGSTLDAKNRLARRKMPDMDDDLVFGRHKPLYTPPASGEESKTIGQPHATFNAARSAYDLVIAETGGLFEVSVYQHPLTGEYVVRLGGPDSVLEPLGDTLGEVLLWQQVLHFRPNNTNQALWRSVSPYDVMKQSVIAAIQGRTVTVVVETPLPDGKLGRVEYTVTPNGKLTIEFIDADDQYVSKQFNKVEAYSQFYRSATVFINPKIEKDLENWLRWMARNREFRAAELSRQRVADAIANTHREVMADLVKHHLAPREVPGKDFLLAVGLRKPHFTPPAPGEESKMVGKPTKDLQHAIRLYDQVIAETGKRYEVAIYQAPYGGDYVVTLGHRLSVDPPGGDIAWRGVMHFHPGGTNVHLWRKPSLVDMRFLLLVAREQRGMAIQIVEHTLPDGKRGRVAYTATVEGKIIVEFLRPDGERVTVKLDNIEEYEEYYYGHKIFIGDIDWRGFLVPQETEASDETGMSMHMFGDGKKPPANKSGGHFSNLHTGDISRAAESKLAQLTAEDNELASAAAELKKPVGGNAPASLIEDQIRKNTENGMSAKDAFLATDVGKQLTSEGYTFDVLNELGSGKTKILVGRTIQTQKGKQLHPVATLEIENPVRRGGGTPKNPSNVSQPEPKPIQPVNVVKKPADGIQKIQKNVVGSEIGNLLSTGLQVHAPSPESVSRAQEAIRSDQGTIEDVYTLIRKSVADSRAYLLDRVGELSTDSLKGMCLDGRDVSALSFESLALESGRKITVYRSHVKNGFESRTSGHAFNVLVTGNEAILIDPTIGQFDVEIANTVQANPASAEFVRNLVQDGYASLTPENASFYGEILGIPENELSSFGQKLAQGTDALRADVIKDGQRVLESRFREIDVGLDPIDDGSVLRRLREDIAELRTKKDINGLLPTLEDLEARLSNLADGRSSAANSPKLTEVTKTSDIGATGEPLLPADKKSMAMHMHGEDKSVPLKNPAANEDLQQSRKLIIDKHQAVMQDEVKSHLAPRGMPGMDADFAAGLREPLFTPPATGEKSKTIGPPHATLSAARLTYDQAIVETGGRYEVGIWLHPDTGEYFVTLGHPTSVSAPGGNISWVSVLHFHPNLSNVPLWRGPSPADLSDTLRIAGGQGRTVTEIVESPLSNGKLGRTAYTVTAKGEVIIDFIGADAQLVTRLFDNLDCYEAYYSAHKIFVNDEVRNDVDVWSKRVDAKDRWEWITNEENEKRAALAPEEAEAPEKKSMAHKHGEDKPVPARNPAADKALQQSRKLIIDKHQVVMQDEVQNHLAPRGMPGMDADFAAGRLEPLFMPPATGEESKTIGQPHATLAAARLTYDQAIVETGGRYEVAIWLHPDTGEYVVTLGHRHAVGPPNRDVTWRSALHFHPNLSNVPLMRMPSRSDVKALVKDFARQWSTATEIVESPLFNGKLGRTAYTVTSEAKLIIEFIGADGQRVTKTWDVINDYYDYHEPRKIIATEEMLKEFEEMRARERNTEPAPAEANMVNMGAAPNSNLPKEPQPIPSPTREAIPVSPTETGANPDQPLSPLQEEILDLTLAKMGADPNFPPPTREAVPVLPAEKGDNPNLPPSDFSGEKDKLSLLDEILQATLRMAELKKPAGGTQKNIVTEEFEVPEETGKTRSVHGVDKPVPVKNPVADEAPQQSGKPITDAHQAIQEQSTLVPRKTEAPEKKSMAHMHGEDKPVPAKNPAADKALQKSRKRISDVHQAKMEDLILYNLAPRKARDMAPELAADLREPHFTPPAPGERSKRIGRSYADFYEARRTYDLVIAETGGRYEVAIWLHPDTGEYVVTLGHLDCVESPNEDIKWRAALHFHPLLSKDPQLWRMPSGIDIAGLVEEPNRQGDTASEIVEYPLPNGMRGQAAYTVTAKGKLIIQYIGADGKRIVKTWDKIEDYDFYHQRTVMANDENRRLVKEWVDEVWVLRAEAREQARILKQKAIADAHQAAMQDEILHRLAPRDVPGEPADLAAGLREPHFTPPVAGEASKMVGLPQDLTLELGPAIDLYDHAIAETGGRNAMAIWQHPGSGYYFVTLGHSFRVDPPSHSPGEGLKWRLVLQFEPDIEGVSPGRLPNPVYVLNLSRVAADQGRTATEIFEYSLPNSKRGRTAYSVTAKGQLIIEFIGADNRRIHKTYGNIDEYFAEYQDYLQSQIYLPPDK